MTNTIGNKIKTLRKNKKMTQPDLADKIGVSYTTVSQYETGSRKPSFKALNRIAEALDVSPSYLLQEDVTGDSAKNEIIQMAARNMQALDEDSLETISSLIKSLSEKNQKGN
ncbi:helix-turn-helix transcriptional regulator [Alkalihalobacillus sp. FSL R5-0424]